MRLKTRVFLVCFVPFALLLQGSFWAIHTLVQSRVKNGLRISLREKQLSVSRVRSRNALQNSLLLKAVGESGSLKAGLLSVASRPGNSEALRILEDRLRELCQQIGFDFMMVSASDGKALAGVIRADGLLRPLGGLITGVPQHGLMMQDNEIYQIISVPIDQGESNLGELSVGGHFDIADFDTPAVLFRNGRVVKASIPGIDLSSVGEALKGCLPQGECEVRLGGDEYVSLPLENVAMGDWGDGYLLRSLENLDSATQPVRTVLKRVFFVSSIFSVLAAVLCTVFSSRTIVKPIVTMIAHLRNGRKSGLLPEFKQELSSIREVRDLTSSFNLASASIREARQNLQHAHVEFVEALANALDARDGYTAGHSDRVSELSCATAKAMGVTGDDLEQIRIGALLHDIGKIGIADSVLQKPGRLTDEEFAIVKQHPTIGRRILECVQSFAPYLAAVELHHENWDGTGYPRGQAGEQTPLVARIIHVSDAYDAMTSDRSYRKGMGHTRAISILREFAGRQFDPQVVEVFTDMAFDREALREEADPAFAGV